MKINPRSLSVRFSLPYVIILLVLVASFAGSFWLSDTLLRTQLDWTLQSDSDALVEIYDIGGMERVSELLEARINKGSKGQAIYLLTDDGFDPIVGNIPAWPLNLPRTVVWGEVDWGPGNVSDRDIRYLHVRLGEHYHLLVGRETVQIEILQDSAVAYYLLFILIFLLLALVGGVLLHRNLSSRLASISSDCESIKGGDLSIRFPVHARGDEIDEMAMTLNRMLDQIQVLMTDIQHVTDNIAHDLRSPMTRVRNRLERLSTELEQTDLHSRALDTIEDLDDLLSTFDAMLKISRIETDAARIEFSRLDLGEIVQDAVDLFEPLADQRGQTIALSIPDRLEMAGDRNLLFQMVANLIDNAIKYGPERSRIDLHGERRGEFCDLAVTDQGPGIPESEFSNITKRFYRLDRSRHRPGNGLGLSLVAAVVALHRGEIGFSNRPGLSVSLRFPASPPT